MKEIFWGSVETALFCEPSPLALLKSPTVCDNTHFKIQFDRRRLFFNANLLIPVLVEGDEVADVAVADVGLLSQHSSHKHVVHPKDPMVAALKDLENIVRNTIGQKNRQ